MEIEYKGANAFIIKTKSATIAIDTALGQDGGKDITIKNGVYLATQTSLSNGSNSDETLLVDGPGEYEVGDLSIKGVATRTYGEVDGDASLRACLYRIDTGDVTVAIVGHSSAPLSEQQLEQLGVVDIVIVPVGGGGCTLDAHQAAAVARQLDPKIVIPSHFADSSLKYRTAQDSIDNFLKEMAVSSPETLPKLKIKGSVPQQALTVVVLEKTT